MDPRKLLANPFNHRRHPESQRKALAAAIREIGFIRSVTVNKTTGHIIDGHARVYQAIEDGQTKIDVELIELSEAEEKLALASFDRISELAEIDPEALTKLLAEIDAPDPELENLFAGMAEAVGEYLAESEKPKTAVAEKPAEADIDQIHDQFLVVISCESEEHQAEMFERLTGEGLSVKVITH